MKKLIKGIGIAFSAAAVWMVVETTSMAIGAGEAQAQNARPKTLSDLLQAVKKARVDDNAANRRRESKFNSELSQQTRLLNEVTAQVVSQEAKAKRNEETFANLDEAVQLLREQLAKQLGSFGELFGIVRQVAGDTRGQIQNSLISAQFAEDRTAGISKLSQSSDVPREEQFEALWQTLTEEMVLQGQVTTFNAEVVQQNGGKAVQEVTRLGPFVAISNGLFLTYDAESQALTELGRQPQSRFTSAAGRVERADSGPDARFVQAAIDPSSGAILSLLVQTPSLIERVNQGGLVGYVIIGIASFGILLGIWRILTLWGTSGAVRRQIRAKRANKSNPLGRVMLAYEENQNTDVETLELKLDDAILKELPKLDFGLNTLKLLAAVSPLLGLLGTVVGMIITFQAITLFGTGDPKLMAGGISQALVTTVLGLVSAIPLLFLHSFASGSARAVQQVLEEQSAGLIARHAEGR
jgi:biopolymer transport protein ExbB